MTTKAPPSAILLNAKDNVATSLRTLKSGETVPIEIGSSMVSVKIQEGIIPAHKFALHDIEKGAYIIKFGQVIGVATTRIRSGTHVHVHNVASLHGRGTVS